MKVVIRSLLFIHNRHDRPAAVFGMITLFNGRMAGSPGFIDFQLAWYSPRRTRLFRIAAYEDVRHLLKHKRTYRADCLTAREQRILARPSPVSRLYMKTFKPLYLFVTRRLLGWADREGAADRNSRA